MALPVASAIVDTTARVLSPHMLKLAGIAGIMLRAGLFSAPQPNPQHSGTIGGGLAAVTVNVTRAPNVRKRRRGRIGVSIISSLSWYEVATLTFPSPAVMSSQAASVRPPKKHPLHF